VQVGLQAADRTLDGWALCAEERACTTLDRSSEAASRWHASGDRRSRSAPRPRKI
ncbi:MAG: hypothetical protein AVDCRST_MAG31-1067, partial [uncultured Sphingomonas sp.]